MQLTDIEVLNLAAHALAAEANRLEGRAGAADAAGGYEVLPAFLRKAARKRRFAFDRIHTLRSQLQTSDAVLLQNEGCGPENTCPDDLIPKVGFEG